MVYIYYIIIYSDLTRFDNIAIQGKGPVSGKEAIGLSALLRYMSTLFLNMFTLLAVTHSVDNLFHSLIVLCENEYFLISNLH